MNYAKKTCAELVSLCKERGIKGYGRKTKQGLIQLIQCKDNVSVDTTQVAVPTMAPKRTRNAAKANETRDIESILRMMNDPTSDGGTRIKESYETAFGKKFLQARRGKAAAGGRSAHYDFEIETEDGVFHVEHKGTQQYAPIDPSLPPWTGGVQFYNGGMEKYRFAKKYAEEWYKMYIGSGVLKERYKLGAAIPTLEDWIKKDAKVQGNPGTEFGKELKATYRELHPGCSLTKERDEFVAAFLSTCTQEDCDRLAEDILPILKNSLAEKHYWLQIAGDLDSGRFHCAWTRQLYVTEIKKIEIVKRSDIWMNIECDNDFRFRGILRFGKGSGFSNIRIDFRD
jgi:hypothetical protein